jgi:hypothetical protein
MITISKYLYDYINIEMFLLTYNGISKFVLDTLINNQIDSGKVETIQWFRYQILKICGNLNIDIHDKKTNNILNNTTLATKIQQHKRYCTYIKNKDDALFGFQPCFSSTYINPKTDSVLLKKDNNVELHQPESIVWQAGQHNKKNKALLLHLSDKEAPHPNTLRFPSSSK